MESEDAMSCHSLNQLHMVVGAHILIGDTMLWPLVVLKLAGIAILRIKVRAIGVTCDSARQ